MALADLHLDYKRLPRRAKQRLFGFLQTNLARLSNMRLYLGLWAVLYAYAVIAALVAAVVGSGGETPGGLMVGVDRFLPLQFVAALAAWAVVLCGRSTRISPRARRISLLPAAVTLAGAFATVAIVVSHQATVPAPYKWIAPAEIWKFEKASAPGAITI